MACRLIPALAFLMASHLAADLAAAPTARVHGQVLEASSGKPIPAASVSAGGTTATTDADGLFEVLLDPGSWTLEARTEDHLPQAQTLVLAPGDDRRIDFYLHATRRLRDEVTVEATIDKDDGPATLPVSPADVLTVAGSADNVFRTLQTLPGVVGVEEFGSRLSVRGGGPDQNLTVRRGG